MIDPVSMRAMSDEMNKIALNLAGVKGAIGGGLKTVGSGIKRGLGAVHKVMRPVGKVSDAVGRVGTAVTGIPDINRIARQAGERFFTS